MKTLLATCLVAVSLALPLAGCNDEVAAAKPPAIEMTQDSLGYYCQMYLLDHDGPKAQIHERGQDQPLWFTQVSDAVTYLKGEERRGDVTAVYVSDMEKAASWAEPGSKNWIDADAAFFVIGSRQLGGMGVPEAIPFGTRAGAEAFVAREGGEIVALADIPDAYVQPGGETAAPAGHDMSM